MGRILNRSFLFLTPSFLSSFLLSRFYRNGWVGIFASLEVGSKNCLNFDLVTFHACQNWTESVIVLIRLGMGSAHGTWINLWRLSNRIKVRFSGVSMNAIIWEFSPIIALSRFQKCQPKRGYFILFNSHFTLHRAGAFGQSHMINGFETLCFFFTCRKKETASCHSRPQNLLAACSLKFDALCTSQ